jgi:DNA invertase Pin-like site-specific DNA recombinase
MNHKNQISRPKNVVFYARYSTDLQHEVSIEQQIDVLELFAESRGWNLLQTFTDRAISGTILKKRPGIQALLRRVKEGGVDIVLCVTVDRISRDSEHGAGILKQLRFHDTSLWTAHTGNEVTDLEMALRTMLSQDLISQIRYRTLEGMAHAVRTGKVAGGMAYGYKTKLIHDSKGDRIRGYRELVPSQAAIIVRIFEQYARGVSPQAIADGLNDDNEPGPRGKQWRDTAIRGHRGRGSGIINNEMYIGRIVWNRREYRKDPTTEKRVARYKSDDQIVIGEDPELRIVSDELWARVRVQQLKNDELFPQSQTNRLNKSHRPKYLLSGLLECGICGGPYATMAKERYGCTNRRKKLKIEELGRIRCTNSKTISRPELEERVLAVFPDRLFGDKQMFSITAAATKELNSRRSLKQPDRGALEARILRIAEEQKEYMQQIVDRRLAGRPPIAALDDMIDERERERETLIQELKVTAASAIDSRPIPDIPPSVFRSFWRGLMAERGGNLNEDGKLTHFVRQMVSKVVIQPSSDGRSADLAVYGQVVAILASLEAWEEHAKAIRQDASADFKKRLAAGSFRNAGEKLEYMNRFQRRLSEAHERWKLLQVSVVAGAGFEPAAFRL